MFAPRLAILFFISLLAFFPVTACSGGGNEGTVERLITLSERQAELIDSITTEKDLDQARSKLRKQARATAEITREVQKLQGSGDFGKVLETNEKLAQRFEATVVREQEAMMRFMARADDPVFEEYMEIMQEARP